MAAAGRFDYELSDTASGGGGSRGGRGGRGGDRLGGGGGVIEDV
jgi:hypothetical protein